MQIRREYRRGVKSEVEYRRVVAELEAVLPWNENQAEKIHQAIVTCHYDQGEIGEALKAFQRAIVLTQPELPLEFDATYLTALEKTQTIPVPFARRMRFFSLVREIVDGEGETVEVGCYRGLSSFLICNYAKGKHHVFDSFQGLSEPGEFDEEDSRWICKKGHFAASLEQVQKALGGFDVEYHPGWVPGTFEGLPERSYRLVHVDLDLYAPTKAALEYFQPRCRKLVCDDYNWAGAKKAVDGYCLERGITPRVTKHWQAIIENPSAA